MGFFDDLKPPPPPEESEEETPDWISAPDGWIGAVLPVQELIGRSEEAAISLARIVAYPVGFEVTLDAFTRAVSWGWAFDERVGEWHRGEHERPPAELLRYGVEFADGRRASNLGGMFGGTVVAMPAADNEEPDPSKDIRLVPGGGHGGGRQSRQEFWVWPLPPHGPVAFVCEWPRYGIPESRVEVAAASIRAAASKAMEIWPAPGYQRRVPRRPGRHPCARRGGEASWRPRKRRSAKPGRQPTVRADARSSSLASV